MRIILKKYFWNNRIVEESLDMEFIEEE